MKRTYVLITFLIIVSLVLGGYALYRAGRHPASQPSSSHPTTVAQEKTPTPSAEPKDVEENLSLRLASPQDLSTVTSPTLTLQGTTAPNADVFINDTEIKADPTGAFSTHLTLDEGDNIIFVSANDSKGDYAEKQLTITYAPSQ